MSAITSDRQTDRIDELEKQAWAMYSASVRDLEGADYEKVEGESWDRLQETLRQLGEERQPVETG